MKNMCLAVFVLLSFAGNAQIAKPDYTKKPPAVFVLTINGKEYTLGEGQPLKIDGNFQSPVVSVKMAPYRKFDNGTVSFNYKSSSNYKYAESAGNKTWTFEDGNCVIFLLGFDMALKLEDVIGPVTAQFGKDNCKTEPVTKKLGGKMLMGTQINVNLAGQSLVQEYYQIVATGSKTYIIAFQNLKKDGAVSADEKAAADMVVGSIKF